MKINHKVLTAALADRDVIQNLAAEAKLPCLLNMEYGTHIVMLISWLNIKAECKSAILVDIFQNKLTYGDILDTLTENFGHFGIKSVFCNRKLDYVLIGAFFLAFNKIHC